MNTTAPAELSTASPRAPFAFYVHPTAGPCAVYEDPDPAAFAYHPEGYVSLTDEDAGGYNWGQVPEEHTEDAVQISEETARDLFPRLVDRIERDAERN